MAKNKRITPPNANKKPKKMLSRELVKISTKSPMDRVF